MKNLCEGVALLGVVIVTLGIALFIYQAAIWLKTGLWHPYPLSTVVEVPSYLPNIFGDWQGFQSLVSWIFTILPGSVVLMAVGSIISFIFSRLSAHYD